MAYASPMEPVTDGAQAARNSRIFRAAEARIASAGAGGRALHGAAAEDAWDKWWTSFTPRYPRPNSMRGAFMAGRRSRDAEVAELRSAAESLDKALWVAKESQADLIKENENLRQAIFGCYVAAGGDTDGCSAEDVARSWSPYPQALVDEVRDNFANERQDAERMAAWISTTLTVEDQWVPVTGHERRLVSPWRIVEEGAVG